MGLRLLLLCGFFAGPASAWLTSPRLHGASAWSRMAVTHRMPLATPSPRRVSRPSRFAPGSWACSANAEEPSEGSTLRDKHVVVIGAGWGGLGTAWELSQHEGYRVTLVDAQERPGGVVRDGFTTREGRPAEAGQHGFWDEYHNIYRLLDELGLKGSNDPLTGYAEQGQYSPRGLEAVWPVYRDKQQLPTGLGQALFTNFLNLSPLDKASAAPLVLAFSEFDDSPEAWERWDRMSFRDLCRSLGVSKKMYDEAFEPMILTGLFAPGEQCSAAAALGMAYFFVLKAQNAFDVRWCRGNIGDKIFAPWVAQLAARPRVDLAFGRRVVGFEARGGSGAAQPTLRAVEVERADGRGREVLECDAVVFAVGMGALRAFSRAPALAAHSEFREMANLRGTDVLATRLFLDGPVDAPYSANACWGFDDRVGMTWFDLRTLHAPAYDGEAGAVLEVDFYHAGALLALSDEDIVARAKAALDAMLPAARERAVLDAAVVRLPQAVNWYFPGSYAACPRTRSAALGNVFFAGDVVRDLRHGAWSQEKALVAGLAAANAVRGLPDLRGVLPLRPDEPHVALGRAASRAARAAAASLGMRPPSLADFIW